MKSLFVSVMLGNLMLFVAGQAMAENAPAVSPNHAAMKNVMVEMQTSLGNITLLLDYKKAPISVKNFLRYVDEGFYNGSIFHRVIPGFMVQGGGFDAKMQRLEGHEPIKNEAENGLLNLRGTIAMARTQAVDSATCQFFINSVDNAFLDHNQSNFGYAVFGKVIQGMSVIHAIEAQPTTSRGRFANVPTKPITIISVARVNPPAA